MLTPEYLSTLPDALVELWQQVEDDILRDIARRIGTLDRLEPMTPTAQWQAWRLEQSRLVQRDVTALLAKYSGKTRAEIRRLLQDAGTQTLAADDEIYRAAGKSPAPVNDSPTLLNLLNAGFRQTLGTWQNLTATTANTVTGEFERALDRAWLQVSSGAFDYKTAIARAVDDLAADGLKAITYPTGHTDTLEVAVRRCVLTGVNQTAAKLQVARMDEMGCEFVEVTAHEGARPEHAVWQGKVYHRGGAVVYNGIRYEDFEDATGYGTGPGLCGWNCRHNFYPFFPGVSERNYTDQRLEELSDPQKYEESQRRRALERRVRDAKRRYLAADAAGVDTGKAAARLKSARTNLARFLEENGLKQDGSRERVQGFGRSEAAKATWAAKKADASDSLRDLNLGIQRVTMESISNVKRFQCNTLDTAGQMALQNAHKRLLLEAAKQPPGTEVARCYGMDMRPISDYIIGNEMSNVQICDQAVPYIAMHTHPSGLTFSPKDIRLFAKRKNMLVLTAVGNNGKVFALEKTVNFRNADTLIRISEIDHKIKQASNAQEGLAIMQNFLQEAEEYGFIYHA